VNPDEAVLEEAAVEETRHDLLDATVEAPVGSAEPLFVDLDESVVMILEETIEGRGSRTPGTIGAPAHAPWRGSRSVPALDHAPHVRIFAGARGDRCPSRDALVPPGPHERTGQLRRDRRLVGGWQRGQKWVERPAARILTIGRAHRGQGSPARPYTLCRAWKPPPWPSASL
jgi:hypothetical protein